MVRRLSSCTSMTLAAAFAVSSTMMAAESAESRLGPIEAAKRELEAVKSSGADPQQKFSPRFERVAPALEASIDTPTILSPIQRARKIEQSRAGNGTQRSSTWLLDAMKKSDKSPPVGATPAERINGGRNTTDGSLLDLSFLGRSDLATREDASADLEKIRSEKSALRAEIHNPLDDYMSKWMSPRDLELLTTQTPSPATLASSVPFRQAPDVSAFLPAASDSFDRGLSTVTSHVAGPTVHPENLYLGNLIEQLTLGAQAPAPPFANHGPTILMPTPPRSVIVERSPSPTKPSLAELLKAKDDVGHFRQLKRF